MQLVTLLNLQGSQTAVEVIYACAELVTLLNLQGSQTVKGCSASSLLLVTLLNLQGSQTVFDQMYDMNSLSPF